MVMVIVSDFPYSVSMVIPVNFTIHGGWSRTYDGEYGHGGEFQDSW
jgi:hypothetical protein